MKCQECGGYGFHVYWDYKLQVKIKSPCKFCVASMKFIPGEQAVDRAFERNWGREW